MTLRSILVAALLASPAYAQPADDRFGPDDLARLATVAEPVLSPDGRQLVYSVKTTDTEADKQQSDLWLAGAIDS
jgi:acylaminoacyl-peptidase